MSSKRLWSIVGILILVEVFASFESAMIFTALPKIVAEYRDVSGTGWLITAFVLAQAATAAIGGRMGDLFGRRRVLLILLAVCSIGSAISAVAHSLEVILVGRVIQGCSGAILPICYGIMREAGPRDRLPFLIGCLTGGYAVGAALGYIIGGLLVDLGGWHAIFICTVVFGVALLGPALLVLPKGERQTAVAGIDFGGLLIVPGVTLMLVGISEAPDWGWLSLATWAFFGGGAAIVGYWARHELRQQVPLIDVRLFARREVLVGNLCFVLLSLGGTQLALILMMILQQPLWTGVGLGISATLAGFIKLPSNIVGGVASPISGYIFGRWGPRTAIFLGGALCTLGYAMLTLFHGSVPELIGFSMVAVIGHSMLLAASPNLILAGTPRERSSEATGVSIVVKGISTALGVQIVTAILASSLVSNGDAIHPSETAYMLTFAFVAAVTTIVLALAPFVPSSSVRDAEPKIPCAPSIAAT